MKQPSDLTRRRFIQTPAAAALAAGAPGLLFGQSPNNQIRAAIIGVGGRGTSLLERIVRSPGVKVVAVCDIDPEAQKRASEVAAADQPEVIADFRKLLDRKDIDAVFIATPVNLHKEMAVAALEVHKHLYLEKPMGRTAEEVKAVMQASKASRGLLQLGFQLRFDPKRRAAIRHIHEGGIGRVAYMHADRHTGDLPRETEWYFDASISGNSIVEQAVHIIDLMNWAVQGHPLQAFGSGGINVYQDQPPGRTTYDHYIAVYEYPGNVRLAFSHIFLDPRGFSGISERVWGSRQAVDLPSATVYELDPQAKAPAEGQVLEFEEDERDTTQRAVDGFFQSVRDNKEPVNNAEYGKYATLAAIMGRMAIDQKRIVKWQEVDL